MQSTDQGQGDTWRRYNALPPFSSFAGKALRKEVCCGGSGLPKRNRHIFRLRAKMEKVSYQTWNYPHGNPAAQKRAGMLESFLRDPEVLSNDQVMALLRIAFEQNPVKEVLEKMLQEAYSDESQRTTKA